MRHLKRLLRVVPTSIVNRRLRQPMARSTLRRLVRFVNEHPTWFEGVEDKVLTTTNFDFPIWCDRRDVIGQEILFTGQWEGLLSQTICACLEPGDLAIDIGANIGYETLLMSQRVGPTGTVIAFEPDPQNLAQLLTNLESVKCRNVVVQSVALSNKVSVEQISNAVDMNQGASNLRGADPAHAVPVLAIRLDSLLGNVEPLSIKLVKMDIEGFEWNAIQGMGRLIEDTAALICEITPKFLEQCGGSAEAIFSHMKTHGFVETFAAEPSSDDKWVSADHRYASAKGHFDALFCRSVPDKLRPLIAAT